jgi:hypothetical protein
MTLGELLTKIKEVQPLADEDPNSGSPETLNARRGRKNQSMEQLARLRRAYTSELMRTAAFIVVVGDKREEFTTIAVNNFKCFSADPEAYFVDLVNRVPRALYMGKESVSNVFDVLGRHIEEKSHELDIVGYPQLLFKQQYQRTLRNPEDFLGLVKEAVTDQIGGEIVGIQAAYSLTNTAIERENTAKFTPIILSAGDERFGIKVANDLERISNRVFFVVAGSTKTTLKNTEEIVTVSEPTKEEVKKALKNISNFLKK